MHNLWNICKNELLPQHFFSVSFYFRLKKLIVFMTPLTLLFSLRQHSLSLWVWITSGSEGRVRPSAILNLANMTLPAGPPFEKCLAVISPWFLCVMQEIKQHGFFTFAFIDVWKWKDGRQTHQAADKRWVPLYLPTLIFWVHDFLRHHKHPPLSQDQNFHPIWCPRPLYQRSSCRLSATQSFFSVHISVLSHANYCPVCSYMRL